MEASSLKHGSFWNDEIEIEDDFKNDVLSLLEENKLDDKISLGKKGGIL
jgi:hypothetical protein